MAASAASWSMWQHVELLAHQRLEVFETEISLRLANAVQRLETALVNGAPRHARIEQATDHRRAHPAGRDRRFELGDPLLQEFAMERTLRRPAQRLRSRRVDADRGLERR